MLAAIRLHTGHKVLYNHRDMPARPPGRPVFLTGMMGSGKSTVAPLLAARWQCCWLDLDTRVERLFAASIPELFTRGEAYFRSCEAAALHSFVCEPGVSARTVVVATGGGIVLDPQNRRQMSKAGCVVFLEVPAGRLVARLMRSDDLGNRPLLSGTLAEVEDRVSQLLADRRFAYGQAALTVDADTTPEVCAERIAAVCAARET